MEQLRLKVASILDAFNREFFRGELPKPIIVIKTNNKFVVRYLPDTFQLVLGSAFCKVPMRVILDAILHECCHVYNDLNHVMDHSRKSQYHNRAFAKTALSVGLNVHKTEYGWIATSTATGELTSKEHWLHREAVYQRLFQQYFDLQNETKFQKTAKTFQYKYQCGCNPPHNSIRSGRKPHGPNGLRVRCEVCNQLFICRDYNDKDGTTTSSEQNTV